MMRSETLRYFGMLGAAVLLAVSVIAGLTWRVDQLRLQRLEGVSTLFLGTSLMLFALPDPRGEQRLSEATGGEILRLAYSGASEVRLLGLARMGARAGVSHILIEVNPIVARFAFEPSDCGWRRRWLEEFRIVQRTGHAILPWRHLFANGSGRVRRYPDGANVDAALARNYPLQVRGPCLSGAWSDLIAHNPQSRFTFVAMPRAPIARDAIGAAGMAAFNAAAINFAQGTGAGVFLVDADGAWEDQYFADQAHMSAAGGDRFQNALITWLGTSQ